MKKFLSVLLALCCVLSLFSMTGGAAENVADWKFHDDGKWQHFGN